jgi:hypothetical protein
VTREVRKGANESWFRDLNERLEDRAAAGKGSDGRFEIVCECAQEECTERITMLFSEYENVRTSPKSFVVVPGHTDPTSERIISSTGAYDVVEKFGEAGLVAEVENPRDG